jgi:cytochrome c-type biogenesis protein CcmH/NrfG
MKKILLPLVALALATPAGAQSIIVVTGPQADSEALPVAYAEIKAGDNRAAVAKLTGETKLDARDPSRLINLGTAYARLGRTDEAAAAYNAAADSPIRYDLELASGRYVDSRWAARTALANLTEGRPLLALAQ